ncbi:glycosyltransferase family 4 protein [Aeoliella mucimassa]|uniref:WecA-like glycosyltransferase n=1 Tax=Aeoliella mucimassa TaxID=2527972 RepID=A0A518AUV4_9BACT|nr:MraY family glycosyltransferase [Aeoliella mucimassa]QDU58504.1 WecA-like glycosyltransferase [Aeoliella mucimassa]
MLDSTTIIVYLIAGVGSFLLSLMITPIVRATSHRLGFVDKPDRRRKAHKAPVALGGGVAVFLGLVVSMAVVFGYATFANATLITASNFLPLTCLAIAAAGIVVLGGVDDVTGLRGRYKLLGQVALTALLIWSGALIEGFSAFGYQVNLGWLAIPATAFWLLGTTNAVNLIDGIDGLAGSVGLILCLTLAAITGGLQDNVVLTATMLALGGSLLAFLRYNFAPATIYLGDTGSMLVGLVCGTVAVLASAKSSAAAAFAVPIAVWSIPILDSFAALLRRKLTGRSMFSPDRGHLHHSLLVRGWSVQQASLFISLICATTCLSAVLSIYMRNEWIAIFTVIAVMVFLVFTKTFGHIEFALVSGRMRRLATSISTKEPHGEHNFRESSIQLQGSREWSKLWAAIVEAADGYKLTRMKLTIDIPLIHEAFYANWETSRPVSRDSQVWHLTHPLIVDGDMVGQMDITGEVQTDKKHSTISQISQILDFFEPIEEDIRYIREDIETEHLSMGAAKAVANPQSPSSASQGPLESPPADLVR